MSRSDGRVHLLTLVLPMDLTTVAALGLAVDDALTGLGWSDIRIATGTYEITGIPPAQSFPTTGDTETTT